MAFKQIGTLARTVLVKAELAAQGHDAARKFEGGAAMPGGATATPPLVALYGRGEPERDGNEVAERDGEIPPSLFSLRLKEPSPVARPVLVLLRNPKCLDTARPIAAPHRRVVSRHLVLVSSHSPTTQSAKSGTA